MILFARRIPGPLARAMFKHPFRVRRRPGPFLHKNKEIGPQGKDGTFATVHDLQNA